MRREKKNLRGPSPSGKFDRQPRKNFLKCICTELPCDDWHAPECQFYMSGSGCKFGDKFSFAHRQVDGQPSKKQKDGDKSAVAVLKDVRQLGCALQDTEPPESLPIARKEPTNLGINSTSTIHKSYAASCKHSRKEMSVARKKSSQSSSSAQSLRYEI